MTVSVLIENHYQTVTFKLQGHGLIHFLDENRNFHSKYFFFFFFFFFPWDMLKDFFWINGTKILFYMFRTEASWTVCFSYHAYALTSILFAEPAMQMQ